MLGTSVAKWRDYGKDLLFSLKDTSLSRQFPENAACSILEKVMWCSFQHCLVYSWLFILFICVKPGSLKKKKSSNSNSLVESKGHSRDYQIWAWLCISHAMQACFCFFFFFSSMEKKNIHEEWMNKQIERPQDHYIDLSQQDKYFTS